MSEPVWIAPPEKTASAARHQFVELYGSVLVMNTYLKVALVMVCAVCVGLTYLTLKALQISRSRPPLIVRIDELGRATAMTGAEMQYRPQERELRFFLIEFVKRHYGRLRAPCATTTPGRSCTWTVGCRKR